MAIKKSTPKSTQKSDQKSGLKNLGSMSSPVKSTPVKLLMVLSILVGGYLVLMPFIPQVVFFLGNLIGEKEYYPYKTDLSLGSGKHDDRVEFGKEKIPEENWLVIPCIGVDAPIAEGETDDALDSGVWHRPGTGSPNSGGNMVLTAHRFKYLPPNNLTFYHLDKVRKSDKVIVYWDEIEYDYVVTEVFIVDPDRVDIEDESVSSVLTLYTCTPLWTADQRLVVIAEPAEQDSEE